MMWLAMNLKQTAKVGVMGVEIDLPLSDLADGCVGVLLLFSTKKAASEYGTHIIEVAPMEDV